jgi:hypothetical protein
VDAGILNAVVQSSRDGFLESFDVLHEVRRLRVEKVTRLQPYVADICKLTLTGQPLLSELSIAVRRLLDSRLLSGEVLEEMVYFGSRLDFLVLVFEQMTATLLSLGERGEEACPEDEIDLDKAIVKEPEENEDSPDGKRHENIRPGQHCLQNTWDDNRDVAYVLRLDRERRRSLSQDYIVMTLALMQPQELYEWFLCPDHGVSEFFPSSSQSCIRSAYALSDETSVVTQTSSKT